MSSSISDQVLPVPVDQVPTPQNCAVLLIDHQVGTMSWVRSMPLPQLKANALALAKAAVALDLPLVLTSSLEERAQGPLMPELGDAAPAPFDNRIRRRGVVDAMDDADFAAAVQATGRRHLVIAGVTNDVCTVYPTLSALRAGYTVSVVADAGGSMSLDADADADAIAVARMQRAGAGIYSTNMLLTELAMDWTGPAGQQLMPIVGELVPR